MAPTLPPSQAGGFLPRISLLCHSDQDIPQAGHSKIPHLRGGPHLNIRPYRRGAGKLPSMESDSVSKEGKAILTSSGSSQKTSLDRKMPGFVCLWTEPTRAVLNGHLAPDP